MGMRKFLSSYSGLDRSIYFLCLAQVLARRCPPEFQSLRLLPLQIVGQAIELSLCSA